MMTDKKSIKPQSSCKRWRKKKLSKNEYWSPNMNLNTVVDEMPKMKGGNSKRGKKESKTEWEKVKNFIGYGKIVSIIERS